VILWRSTVPRTEIAEIRAREISVTESAMKEEQIKLVTSNLSRCWYVSINVTLLIMLISDLCLNSWHMYTVNILLAIKQVPSLLLMCKFLFVSCYWWSREATTTTVVRCNVAVYNVGTREPRTRFRRSLTHKASAGPMTTEQTEAKLSRW
jgi:hypothetical protein